MWSRRQLSREERGASFWSFLGRGRKKVLSQGFSLSSPARGTLLPSLPSRARECLDPSLRDIRLSDPPRTPALPPRGESSGFSDLFPPLPTTSWRECMLSHFSRVRLFASPWTLAHQAPLSMGFSRQEAWSGLPFPSPEDLPDPGIEPRSLTLQVDSLPSEPHS